MFLIKIFHFLKGYVILLISGQNKEEFINSIIACGIKPYRIEIRGDAIETELSLSDFLGLKRCGSGTKVHILKKCGLVFVLRRLKKRKAFIAGAAAFALVFVLGSQFIWTLNFEGAENCDMAQLNAAVRLAGVREGMLKRDLKSGIEIKNIILNHTDNICWAWVYVKGTKAVVKVRENIIPPEVFDPDVPCDIIAARSGIIKNITAYRGERVKEENTAVAPGDTVISGSYAFLNGGGYLVHAKGEVEAYTEHVRSGTYKQNYCYKKYSGRKRRFLTLKILNYEIPLYIKRDIKFKNYDSISRDYEAHAGDYYFGIGINTLVCEEYTAKSEPISRETAVHLAELELEKEIARELLPGARMVGRNTEVTEIDNETISVTLRMSFIEQIGTEKRIEEVTFVEPKTDRASVGD